MSASTMSSAGADAEGCGTIRRGSTDGRIDHGARSASGGGSDAPAVPSARHGSACLASSKQYATNLAVAGASSQRAAISPTVNVAP